MTLKGSKCFLLGGEGREKTLLGESGGRVLKKEVEGDESGRRDWNWKCKRIVLWTCSAIYTYTKDNEWKCKCYAMKRNKIETETWVELSWVELRNTTQLWLSKFERTKEKCTNKFLKYHLSLITKTCSLL